MVVLVSSVEVSGKKASLTSWGDQFLTSKIYPCLIIILSKQMETSCSYSKVVDIERGADGYLVTVEDENGDRADIDTKYLVNAAGHNAPMISHMVRLI